MKLKKVINGIIPLEGYIAMTVFPWVFIRKENAERFDEVAERHETTHGHQQVEMLFVGTALAGILAIFGCGWWSLLAVPVFFGWYVIEWLIKSVLAFFANKDGYYSISFEQEAFLHEKEPDYNYEREPFAWTKYIFTLTKRPRNYYEI